MAVAEPQVELARVAGHAGRVFASDAGEERVRRPLDAVTAVAAAGVLGAWAWWAQPTHSFERELQDGLTSSPGWLQTAWVLCYSLVAVLAGAALVATVARRRWPLLVQCLVSAAAAALLVAATNRYLTGEWPSLGHALGLGDGVAWPAAAITVTSATLLALTADVTEPVRSIGMRAIGLAAVAAVLAGRTTPTGAVAALLAAVAAAAIGRLVAGTAAGRVSREQVIAILAALGVDGLTVQRFSRQADGVVLAEARDASGRRLLVKVLGRDVAEQRRILRTWRSLVYRDGGAAFALARAPGLERESLTTLLAEVKGVPVWNVVAAGHPDGPDEALVLAADGDRVGDLPVGAFSEPHAAAAWQTLDALHAARLAHMDIGLHSLVVRDGEVALTDFTDAVLAARSEAILTDDAQLLVVLAVLADPQTAVATARAGLPAGELAKLLPYLQPAALPRELRAAAKTRGLDMEALRASAAEAAGVDVPELASLRRITWWSVAQSALLVLAASAIISFFSGLDLEQLREAFRSASVPLVVAAFVIAQLPRLTQAIATLGSVPARLAYGPVYAMELATSFMNVALPSAAARMALSVRFFQRQGLAPATAVTSGIVNSFIGNVVQAILLGALLLFSNLTLNLDQGGSSGGGGDHTVVQVIAAGCVAAVAALLVSARLRALVLTRMRAWWPDVKAVVGALHDRHKAAQLLVGTIATEILFASALAIMVHAFGGDISLVEALFVNLTASLFADMIPVPGGIGVAESALIVGLTGVGVGEDTAFGATICYRISTFYLPPLWGWVAMRWLERKAYL